MFYLTKPDAPSIQKFLESQQEEPFSYAEVGASQDAWPSGYNHDHSRMLLGVGPKTFDKAVAGLKNWEMFELGWVTLCGKEIPRVGLTVGVLIRHLGFWSLNASRIVYVVDDPGKSYGFAYGTLTGHAERGEERFMVEYDGSDDSVWYDLSAFSKPNHVLARAGYPISRTLQKRFARDSLQAMLKAVNS